MSFRLRLLLAFTVALLVPLALLAWGVRREVERRLADESERRVEAVAGSLRAELAAADSGIAGRLAGLRQELAADNRFRLALRGDLAARRELLDWGGKAARLSGLALLEVQDGSGRVLTSGHFRNEYDRRHPALVRFLARGGSSARLVRARTPGGALLALARLDSLRLAGEPIFLVGGLPFGEPALARLSPDPGLSLRLVADRPPDLAPGERVVREVPLPLLEADAEEGTTATVALIRSDRALAELRRGLARWFAAALAGAAALGLGVATWLTSRMTRPLTELAARTEAVDLDRLDQEFASRRQDEIGTLARGLGAMTARLRAGAARLREAERRVAMGDLARQVNHDVKNGLVPIRHVLRHLDEVATAPDQLARVYGERRGTLESSIAYLETLARNYARLTPATARGPCDVNAVVDDVLREVPAERARVRTRTSPGLPPVAADRVALRRILENLVSNAVDSVAATGAPVEIVTEAVGDHRTAVRIVVVDGGAGMSPAELDRAFEGFYTTKEHGTGLGLPIVRRLVLDLGGVLRVDTRPGEGTRVTVELPASAGGEEA